MNGNVDTAGRALMPLKLRADLNDADHELLVWIDTAFDGELVVPRDVIARLGLKSSAGVSARLADGTIVVLETFHCHLEWFGKLRQIEVIGNDGQTPLLGIGLLRDRKLIVDYRTGTLSVD